MALLRVHHPPRIRLVIRQGHQRPRRVLTRLFGPAFVGHLLQSVEDGWVVEKGLAPRGVDRQLLDRFGSVLQQTRKLSEVPT